MGTSFIKGNWHVASFTLPIKHFSSDVLGTGVGRDVRQLDNRSCKHGDCCRCLYYITIILVADLVSLGH